MKFKNANLGFKTVERKNVIARKIQIYSSALLGHIYDFVYLVLKKNMAMT